LYCGIGLAEEPKKDAAAELPKPKITIGKETTFITEPLDAKGFPDYVAAMNQRLSQGVTSANNGAIVLLKAMGPHAIPEKSRGEVFRLLGIEALPEKGDYLVLESEMIERWKAQQPAGAPHLSNDELEAQFDLAAERPEMVSKFPVVVQWLAINEKPLRILLDGAQRSAFYVPLVATDEQPPLLGAYERQLLQNTRGIASLLRIHALAKLQQGNTIDAWNDALCCHRLARWLDQEPTLVDALITWAINAVACNCDAQLAHFGKLSHKEAGEALAKLQALQALRSTIDKIDLGERFWLLDAVGCFARGNPKELAKMTGDQSRDAGKQHRPIDVDAVDWDVVFRCGNEWFDKLVTAGRVADSPARQKALVQVGDDFDKLLKQVGTKGSLLDLFSGKSAKELISQRIGLMLAGTCMPATNAALSAETRARMTEKLAETAIVLAEYRADFGRYPEQLQELVPKYLPAMPEDKFAKSPGPIRYRLEGDAYVLWSVGSDGNDDGGHSYEEDSDNYDIVLRPVSKAMPESK
jgi:hypothetical protein